MSFRDVIHNAAKAVAGMTARAGMSDRVIVARASADVRHRRPYDFDEKRGLFLFKAVDEDERVYNVKTTVGIDFLHTQGYGTSPAANGLNYIGLSNDSLTETTASTTLSSEIAANGLSRAIGAVVHTTAATTTTVDKTFTCATGAQAAQKAALFTASSSGTMGHALAFTQRSLQIGDTLQITYTLTLS